MIKHLDKRGIVIEVDDVIVYGKSGRYDPIRIGVVLKISEDYIEVLGRDSPKSGMIPSYHANRIIVLPDDY